MRTSAAPTVAVNWHTLEGLTELHPATREAYAALASELPETEDTTVEVTLREGAVFHDGSPVTAEDVVFSFERVLDRSEEHTSELQSRGHLVCRLLLEKKK